MRINIATSGSRFAKTNIALTAAALLSFAAAAQNSGAPANTATSAAPPAHGQDVIGTQDGVAKNQITDADFVRIALQTGLAEVEIARLAMKKSSNDDLRKFAQVVMQDNIAANTQLKALAQKLHLYAPNQLNTDHAQEVERLRGLDGAAFDKEFLAWMQKDYDTAVGLYDNAKDRYAQDQSNMNAALRDFAARKLPAMRHHQKLLHMLPGTPAHPR